MIGVYDSGVGGLSVWRELYKLMPEEGYIYVSDSAYCPYGTKPVEDIIARADAITRFFLSKKVDVIVVACNTATAASIRYLRETFSIPFIGMEPAIKPAALTSESGVVGVLATANTFKGSLYNNTLEKFAAHVKVIERVGEGLVELVEAGKSEGEDVERLLHLYIDPMVEAGADAIVLGCTHYPFLTSAIAKIVGPSVKIINPAPAVALQTKRIIDAMPSHNSNRILEFYSSGDTSTLRKIASFIEPDLSYSCIKKLCV